MTSDDRANSARTADRKSADKSGANQSQEATRAARLSFQQRQALLELFRAGQFEVLDAKSGELIATCPEDPFLCKVRGTALAQLGQSDAALSVLRSAASLSPLDPEIPNTIGHVLQQLNRHDEAIAAFQKALELRPDYAEAHFNLGLLLQRRGEPREAEAAFRRSLNLAPDRCETHSKLATTLRDQGRLLDAEQAFRRALELDPDHIESLNNLGNLLLELGRPADGLRQFEKLAAKHPSLAEVHNNLGNVHLELNDPQKAEASYRRALALNPDLADAWSNLGSLVGQLGRLEEAEDDLRRALTLNPASAKTHYSLGTIFEHASTREDAAQSYRQALSLASAPAKVQSNALFSLAYGSLASPRVLRECAENWEHATLSAMERDLARQRVFTTPDRAGRSLRIGLLSAEFGKHPVANFLQSWLPHVDRDRFDLIMYPTIDRGEAEVGHFRNLADAWHPVVGLSDEQAAERIRADRIDILIDTSGHTANNRLGVIAHRAAPVQCHYIGYFGTTGLTEMDWLLADASLLPPHLDEHFTENIWRLPRPWLAYRAPEELANTAWQPDPSGTLWLGSFNNLDKVTTETLGLWAQVMVALPAGKLLLKQAKAANPAVQARVISTLAAQGITANRITFLPPAPSWREHMAQYDRLDIALETLPYNGGTTAFEALWMGVPLITLAGGTTLNSRLGTAILSGFGRREWIADNPEDYVRKVVGLARDRDARLAMRARQRDQLQHSPLCDGIGLARALESAFEDMFDLWRDGSANRNQRSAVKPALGPVAASNKPCQPRGLDQADSNEKADPAASSSAAYDHETLLRLWATGPLPALEQAARQATEQSPSDSLAWKILGGALIKLGQLEPACAALQQALVLDDQDADSHSMHGHVLTRLGATQAALTAYARAIELAPHHTAALFNRGSLHSEMKQWEAAEHDFRQVIALDADHSQALLGLGFVLSATGRLLEAESVLRSALQPNPRSLDAHNLLGHVLKDLRRAREAETCYRAALSLDPNNLSALASLGGLGPALGKLREAEQYLRTAIAIRGDFPQAHWNLGQVLSALGQPHAAEQCFRRALAIEPGNAHLVSDLLFTTNYAVTKDAARLRQEAEGWERAVLSAGVREAAKRQTFTPSSRAHRPLRLGLLSAELGDHSVAFFLRPWLRNLDRQRFQVIMYPTKPRPESASRALRALSDEWTPLIGRSDEDAAARIRADRIDILVETSGHTSSNRLGVIARRAAPVQCHYVGYFGTTGLSEMDWFMADEVLIPPALERGFSERIWRLPRPWLAYDTPENAPAPDWQPAADGTLWLGSFNNFNKVRDESLLLWARVLRELPQARLLLKQPLATDPIVKQRIRDTLSRAGLIEDRVVFADPTDTWQAHMAQYNRLDIALDTYPLTSGTTAFETLWMGVPLVTLTGATMAGRMSASILTGLGRTEWIATNEDDYVAIVVALAQDIDRRRHLRAEQRERMCNSPLCDSAGLAQALADAFEGMFDHWLERQGAQPKSIQLVDSGKPESAADDPAHHHVTAADENAELLNRLWHEGRFSELERAARAATAQAPGSPVGWKMLGAALLHGGQQAQAITALERAIALDDRDADAHNLLGCALTNTGQHQQARDALDKAIALQPERASFFHNRGHVSDLLARKEDAEAYYQRALALQPDYTPAWLSLGALYNEIGRYREAEECLRAAIKQQPESADAHNLLGQILREQKDFVESESSYHAALIANPTHVPTLCNLGGLYRQWGRLEQAERLLRRAIAHQADDHRAHNQRGLILQDLGRIEEAEACFRRALQIKPHDANSYSNLLFTLGYTGSRDPRSLRVLAEGWEQTVLSPAERDAARHRRANIRPRNGRALRVGLLSAELGTHAVAFFLRSWIGALNRDRVQLWMYPTKARPEAETDDLRTMAAAWVPLVGVDDQEAAARIRADGIDILIDTSGHTAANRLGIVARRAAPVQCHYIGYFGTTGLSEMDWFLADASLIPPQLDEQFTEGVWRLPRPWLAYQMPPDIPEPVWQPDPDGTLWLGSFNNLTKVREPTLQLWAKVLHQLPEAKLLLKQARHADAATQARIQSGLTSAGIDGNRIVFVEPTDSWREHMLQYSRLDVALETIPYNSGTTAFDALSMGIPIIALGDGSCMSARMGAAILKGLDRSEWIAADSEHYVTKVVALARDRDARETLRFHLREQMRASPLCDGAGLARALEDAFEQMFDQRSGADQGPRDSAKPPKTPNHCLPPIKAPAPPNVATAKAKKKQRHRKRKSSRPGSKNASIDQATRNQLLNLLAQQRFAEADQATQELVERAPGDGLAWTLRASALAALGRHQAALAAIEQAIRFAPDDPDPYNIKGGIWLTLGEAEKAIPAFEAALARRPHHAKALYNLACACHQLGRTTEAEQHYLAAIEQAPRLAKAHNNFGSLLVAQGRLAEAEHCLRQAIDCDPTLVDAHVNLGNLLEETNRRPEAIASYQQALALDPNRASAHCNLGVTLRNLNRLEESEHCYRQALALRPDYADAIGNLAWTLHSQGRFREALDHYRRALSIDPRNGRIHSNLLFTLSSTDLFSPGDLRREAEAWELGVLSEAERQAARRQRFDLPAAGSKRPLRLGILSAELGKHPVALFLRPWLRALDRDQISVHMYPTKHRLEAESQSLRALADSWIPMIGLSDQDAVARIRADHIDVLIETSGHTADNRLGVIARRAAPVQCHYIGYYGTTGLTEMDWFIADEHLVPPALDAIFTERVWRLPRPWLAYDIPEDAPEPTRAPAEDDSLWLGCFNNLAKVGEQSLRLWAKVLQALPTAKLLLKDGKATDPKTQDRILAFLGAVGVTAERIRFAGTSPSWTEHMAQYNRLDIALDPLPLNSGTTAFDTLWMGVPLVTLAGDRMGGRMGTAILSGLGQADWIAHDEDEYVAIVARLAQAADMRQTLRHTQRQRMQQSPLCDGGGLASALEHAFFRMLAEAMDLDNN
ncbi:TPR repeat-containing protein YrrB [Thiorhodovibrio winogradskyi]|uniref:protein O-GlcNAc transferase n=1 Tax=Thiorhodovibrio winogradskyi TaxID=77007 RepID=A0ABZ0SDI1_9GAMM|nr:tetratricopeptide repeat protein [Thiorhodovibrio winogradskyi]